MIRDYLPITDEATCKKTSGSVNYTIQICAGSQRGRDTCNGDSGGPMAFRRFSGKLYLYYQVGIVSFGSKICGIKNQQLLPELQLLLIGFRQILNPNVALYIYPLIFYFRNKQKKIKEK